MKLYKTADAPAGQRWTGSKTGLKHYDEVEMPKDGRAAMAAFLNAAEIEVGVALPSRMSEPVEEHDNVEAMAEVGFVREAARRTFARMTTSEIEDHILHHASVADVERIFACLGTRFAELRHGQA